MRTRFGQLSLPAKILLSTFCAVTLLFAVGAEIVRGNITSGMSNGLKEREEMRASLHAYQSIWQSRKDLLRLVSSIFSETKEAPAFYTGDKATIERSVGEQLAGNSRADAILLVTEPNGEAPGAHGGVTSTSTAQSLEIARTAAAKYPAHIEGPREIANLEDSGFYLQNGAACELYQIAVIPVYFDSPSGRGLRKVLVASYKVDAAMAWELKNATGSDFLFYTRDGAIASTLNPRATSVVRSNLLRAKDTDLVSDGVQKYAWFRQPLCDISGRKVAEICILRSFEGGGQLIASLSTAFLLLWLAATCAALGLVHLLARRIAKPMEQLDRAAAEVVRRNYAIEVEVSGEDGTDGLARTFNAMCASIRHAREELIRYERVSNIGRLSESIVHDLRNPLAAIYGGAEMLGDGDLPPAYVKRLAGNIYRASRSIHEMLQELLNVSRGVSRAPEPCCLREIAVAACESVSATAESNGTTLAVEITPEIELPLERGRIERAFVNLIGNAIEAMPEGGEVRISAQFFAGSVVVHVDDTGPGVVPEIRSKLFQPFVTAGKRNGLGLGLAHTRQAVLEHGGDLSVGSSPSGGARFSLRLPGAYLVQRQALAV